MSYGLRHYGAMVRDERRIDAYARALERALPPDGVVCELGTGTGIVAFDAVGAADDVKASQVASAEADTGAHREWNVDVGALLTELVEDGYARAASGECDPDGHVLGHHQAVGAVLGVELNELRDGLAVELTVLEGRGQGDVAASKRTLHPDPPSPMAANMARTARSAPTVKAWATIA